MFEIYIAARALAHMVYAPIRDHAQENLASTAKKHSTPDDTELLAQVLP